MNKILFLLLLLSSFAQSRTAFWLADKYITNPKNNETIHVNKSQIIKISLPYYEESSMYDDYDTQYRSWQMKAISENVTFLGKDYANCALLLCDPPISVGDVIFVIKVDDISECSQIVFEMTDKFGSKEIRTIILQAESK